MNWRRRPVSPKEQSTDARGLALAIEWPARSGTDPTYSVGREVRDGSCVTSTAGSHGSAQLYER